MRLLIQIVHKKYLNFHIILYIQFFFGLSLNIKYLCKYFFGVKRMRITLLPYKILGGVIYVVVSQKIEKKFMTYFQ